MQDRQPVSPPSPYDDPTPCPECGIGDAEYSEHEPGCPSGYPTRAPDPELADMQAAYRETEDEAGYGAVHIERIEP
jgi:hypothetical protein